jgi:SAM-dependent methyltransferase
MFVGVEMAGEERGRDAEIAYEAIAPVYDDFTHHHDYELWLGNLLPELERLGLRGNRLLDVACGTGKSFIPMLNRGWEVTASDISPAMVELARAKVGDRADLSVADMRDLPDCGRFPRLSHLLRRRGRGRARRPAAGLERAFEPGGRAGPDLRGQLRGRWRARAAR